MPRNQTMLQYLVGRVGLRRATGVAAFVVAWGVYSEKSEAPHTLDGYAKFWNQSLTKTYRERDTFRLCFPDDKVPDRVWAAVREVYDAKLDERHRELSAARFLELRGSWG